MQEWIQAQWEAFSLCLAISAVVVLVTSIPALIDLILEIRRDKK